MVSSFLSTRPALALPAAALAALSALALLSGHAAHAAPISYTISGTGSGTLGATSFTNATFSLTFNADTVNVTSPAQDLNAISTFSSTAFTIGATNTSLTGQARLTSRFTTGDLFLGNPFDVAFFSSAALVGNDLKMAYAPTNTSPTVSNNGQSAISTGAGDLRFSSLSNTTYTAVVSNAVAAPEPGTLPLVGMGLVSGLGVVRGVRRRKATKASA